MDLFDIASDVYGDFLFSQRSKNAKNAQAPLIETIRNNIGHAINLAAEQGYTISIKRKPTLNDNKKKFRILGWRIFVPGEDEVFLIDELKFKKNNGESRIDSFNKLKEKALNKGLLDSENMKELTGK
ncbi:hypothetical protein GF312_00570 [Candidatus Poribacteria bacterium]|nr:hypothetical protein [Candidatus Poribacteria bacterium]